MHSTFIAALFTIAKTWGQPKCPSTDEWIKMWDILYRAILLSHKKKEVMPLAGNMDEPKDHHTK